jgi:hypothetical protein
VCDWARAEWQTLRARRCWNNLSSLHPIHSQHPTTGAPTPIIVWWSWLVQMEEIRWGLLWRQMSVEEQWMCMFMLGLIVLRIAQKLARALSSLRQGTPTAEDADASGTGGTTHKDWAKGGRRPRGKRLRVMLAYAGGLWALGAGWWHATTPVRVALPLAELDALAMDLARGAKLPGMPVRTTPCASRWG